MLRIKDEVNIHELRKYGFVLEPEGTYYNKINKDNQLFIAKVKNNVDFKHKEINMDILDYSMIINDFDTLYDLINDGLVEKVTK